MKRDHIKSKLPKHMKKTLTLITLLGLSCAVLKGQTLYTIEITNPNRSDCQHAGVTVDLSGINQDVRSAYLTEDGKEIPCQLDDTDGNGTYDELFFYTDMKKKSSKQLQLSVLDYGQPRTYKAEVYADMMLTNKKIKESNKQDLYISHLTVDRGVNPYWMLHHHGCAFENEMVAYRIYFDHRQTVDTYGKNHKGLELRDTQFYPDKEQKALGYGDDVLWVGSTFGLGTVRGWNGQTPTMVNDVEHRTQRIIARGPLRTIIEVIDEAWRPQPDDAPVDMRIRYTLESGRRDCRVDLYFGRECRELKFSTGVIKVKDSEEFSDHSGLRGCWGTDWPVSEKDSVGHKRETVGLGVCVPTEYLVNEMPEVEQNLPLVFYAPSQHLTYYITFGSDNEDFGMHSAKEWFAYLKSWKKELSLQPIKAVLKE